MVRLHLWSVPIHRLLCDNATVYHGNDRIPLQGYVRYRKKTFREIKLNSLKDTILDIRVEDSLYIGIFFFKISAIFL